MQTIATSTGSLPWAVAPQPSARASRCGLRLAHPHGLDAARVRGGDVQQAAAARADDEQAVAGPEPGAVLRPQRAGERLGERGRARGRARRAGAARRPARPARARARRSRPGRGAVARNCSHSVSCPRRQRRHSPHGAWWWIATRSPTATPSTPAPTSTTSPTGSWPSTAGSLRSHVPADVRAAVAHASTRQTTSPGPAVGVGHLLDPTVSSTRERCARPSRHRRRASPRSPAAATPRSVTSAQTSSAGVTSNAGLRHGVPGTVSSAPPARAHLVGVALLDLDRVAGRRAAGRPTTTGPAATNGIPAARAASASP